MLEGKEEDCLGNNSICKNANFSSVDAGTCDAA
jgi:hypothetical protein